MEAISHLRHHNKDYLSQNIYCMIYDDLFVLNAFDIFRVYIWWVLEVLRKVLKQVLKISEVLKVPKLVEY